MRIAASIGILILALGWPASAGARAAQSGQGGAQTPPVLTEETFLLYNGWALLAAGEPEKAASSAQAVLAKYPRSIAAAALLIEAEIARGGGLAGLTAYETWLGTRKLEDGYLLRRAARAVLWGDTTKPEVAVDALQYLAADDDAEARAQLARRMMAGSIVETRALARLGDEGAVRQLVDQLEKNVGPKAFLIEALIESHSPLAIPPLTNVLADANHPEFVAAAAGGLGTLNAREAIPQLQRLYEDKSQLFSVRFFAAAGLYKMNDQTGVVFLQQQLASETPLIRAEAAKQLAAQPTDGTWQSVVRALAGDQDPVVRLKAGELLASQDLELARQTLEPLLTNDNGAVRELAGRAVASRTATDFGTLRRLLRSADPGTQVAAAGRILELTR